MQDGLVGVWSVQVGPDGQSGAVEGGAGEECTEVHVRGEGLAVVVVVEDLVRGFAGVVRGVQFGVLAEPRGGVEYGAEGELFGVRSEEGGFEGRLDAVVEVAQGRVVLESVGELHAFTVGADMVA